MAFNLALILTLLTVLAGVLVLMDKLVWKTSEGEVSEDQKQLHMTVDISRSFFPVLLFVLVIRSFVFEPFRIPSGSMMPTLVQGDFVFVKKYAYGLRLPVSETKILETGSPERGDVVVFRLPSNPKINYIKRVIGLPGDTIVYERHRLTINGEVVSLEPGEEGIWQAPEYVEKGNLRAPIYVEDLAGRSHDILVTSPEYSARDDTYTVPEGHYFVMGDNRDHSRDSRFIGSIPEEFLVGEAVRVWMHFVPGNMPDWGRIGTKIQ